MRGDVSVEGVVPGHAGNLSAFIAGCGGRSFLRSALRPVKFEAHSIGVLRRENRG
jgi:hypothetical protein